MNNQEIADILEECLTLDDTMYQYNSNYTKALEKAIEIVRKYNCTSTVQSLIDTVTKCVDNTYENIDEHQRKMFIDSIVGIAFSKATELVLYGVDNIGAEYVDSAVRQAQELSSAFTKGIAEGRKRDKAFARIVFSGKSLDETCRHVRIKCDKCGHTTYHPISDKPNFCENCGREFIYEEEKFVYPYF